MVTLRVAQNQVIPAADKKQLQDWVDHLVAVVGQEPNWNDKDGMFFLRTLLYCRSIDAQPFRIFADRRENSRGIVEQDFLPDVVGRCHMKITAILREPYSKPFRTWYAKELPSLMALGEDIAGSLAIIYHATTMAVKEKQKDSKLILAAVLSAWSADVTATFESRWLEHDTPTAPSVHDESIDDESVDDEQSLDPADMQKSAIQRFLRKLARYYSACYTIVQELVSVVRSGNKLCIKIETVPISISHSTPSLQNEYDNLDGFLERLHIKRGTLDPKKTNQLYDKWAPTWKSANLFLHAEMQLVLFYGLQSRGVSCPTLYWREQKVLLVL